MGRMMRPLRLLGTRIGVLLTFSLSLVFLCAGPAAATPDIPNPLPPLPIPHLPFIPDPAQVCNNTDPPMPASPYGDGSWIVRLSTADPVITGGHQVAGGDTSSRAADPFTDKGVSLESVYGTTPQWFTYDNGCTGRVMAGAGTSLGNIALELEGALPNWVEALLSAVVDPSSWSSALDQPVARATAAVADGVWGPWLGIALILVAILVMLRSREGRLGGAITAAAWALGVLVIVSWLVQYPVESVRMVDSGVRRAVVDIVGSFDNGQQPGPGGGGGSSAASAKLAIDHQMDNIVRDTMYRTWLTGVFGDPDSSTARQYGPRLFRDTHFSWTEYDTYKADPSGAGAKIVEDKQNDFKLVAAKVKDSDPVAYSYFTGSHWSQRLSLVVVNGLVLVVVCGFLLMSGLAILLAFALVRILVPFAPVAGIVYMLESTRELALGMLKKVVGPLVMGPVYLVVGLVLLRFDATLLTSSLWLVVKIALIFVTTWVAWRLTRPAAYGLRVPGLATVRRAVTTYIGARVGADAGTKAGIEEARHRHTDETEQYGHDVMPKVAAHQVAASPPSELSAPARDRHRGQPPPPPGNLQAAAPPRGALLDDDPGYDPHEARDELYRPATEPPVRGILRHEKGNEWSGSRTSVVAPANVDYDDQGNPVFVIYHPAGNRHVRLDDHDMDVWTSGSEGAA